jgi:hypothetical protein
MRWNLQRPGKLTFLFVLALFVVGASAAWAGADKVQVCHIPPGNPDNFHTISVSQNALQAHLDHGDLSGPCYLSCTTLCTGDNSCTTGECSQCACALGDIDSFNEVLNGELGALNFCTETVSTGSHSIEVESSEGSEAIVLSFPNFNVCAANFKPPQTITPTQAQACIDLIRAKVTAAGITCTLFGS